MIHFVGLKDILFLSASRCLLSVVQFSTDDECAWDYIEFIVMLSMYCSILMSPEENLILLAFYPLL